MGRKERKKETIISKPKHMLRVLKRTISMGRLFWAPQTHVKIDGYEKFLILSTSMGDNWNKQCFSSIVPLLKIGTSLKGKNSLPEGANSFL